MPSISTAGVPLIVATSTTRTSGMAEAPASKNDVCKSERLLSENVNWNPLGPSTLCVTSTDVKASTTSRGAGRGVTGPIISVRCMPLSIVATLFRLASLLGDLRECRHAFGQRDPDPPRDTSGQVEWVHVVIGVGDSPKLLGIAHIARGDIVQTIAVRDGVFLERLKAILQRHEAPRQIGELLAVGTFDLVY